MNEEELVIEGIRHTSTGDLPLDAAKKVLKTNNVPQSVLFDLALVGLAKRIADVLSKGRIQERKPKAQAEAERRAELELVRAKVATVISKHIRVLRSIALDCDGRLVKLHDFSFGDVRAWRDRAERHANGWGARAEWFRIAESAIIAAKKKSVSALPDATLKALATAAEKAWSDGT